MPTKAKRAARNQPKTLIDLPIRANPKCRKPRAKAINLPSGSQVQAGALAFRKACQPFVRV